ncbi:unnamed protein product [Ilex paraguariensis]|uniref:Nicastrin n=1 Tax=Ilex paraguariensis TaxID=185542 RepID=A0ABC8QZL5_9AQUA
MGRKLLYFLLCIIFRLRLSLSDIGQVKQLESVPDLEKLMYMVVDGYPCVRLLSLSGEIGCSNPGRDKVVAPIVRFKNANELARSSAILVSLDEFDSLFLRVSNDSDFARNIAGVLVESGTMSMNQLKGLSPDKKFPQAEFAPYQSNDFEWNPTGSGILWKSYGFPVFLLSQSNTSTLLEVAMKNEKSKKGYTEDVAEFDLVMQTTKAGTHDSKSCLKENTCLPLGGYRLNTLNVSYLVYHLGTGVPHSQITDAFYYLLPQCMSYSLFPFTMLADLWNEIRLWVTVKTICNLSSTSSEENRWC